MYLYSDFTQPSAQTTFGVVGRMSSKKKVRHFRRLGIKIINEEKLLRRLCCVQARGERLPKPSEMLTDRVDRSQREQTRLLPSVSIDFPLIHRAYSHGCNMELRAK